MLTGAHCDASSYAAAQSRSLSWSDLEGSAACLAWLRPDSRVCGAAFGGPVGLATDLGTVEL